MGSSSSNSNSNGTDSNPSSPPPYPVRIFLLDDDQASPLMVNQPKILNDQTFLWFNQPEIEILQNNNYEVFSADSGYETAVKGFLSDAGDYLVGQEPKPLAINGGDSSPAANGVSGESRESVQGLESSGCNSSVQKRKKGGSPAKEGSGDGCGAKKQRLIWTQELHKIFIEAVRRFTPEKAVPKKILEYMLDKGVVDITRENVASHLQKFRLYLKKRHDLNQAERPLKLPAQSVSLNASKESNFKRCSVDQCYHHQPKTDINSTSHQYLPQPMPILTADENHPINQCLLQWPHNNITDSQFYRSRFGFQNLPSFLDPSTNPEQIAQVQRTSDIWTLQVDPPPLQQPKPEAVQAVQGYNEDMNYFPLMNDDSLYSTNLSHQFDETEIIHPFGDIPAMYDEILLNGTSLDFNDDNGYNNEAGFSVDDDLHGDGNDSDTKMYVSEATSDVFPNVMPNPNPNPNPNPYPEELGKPPHNG